MSQRGLALQGRDDPCRPRGLGEHNRGVDEISVDEQTGSQPEENALLHRLLPLSETGCSRGRVRRILLGCRSAPDWAQSSVASMGTCTRSTSWMSGAQSI